MKISAISAYRQSPISAYRHIGKNVISARPYIQVQLNSNKRYMMTSNIFMLPSMSRTF